MLVLTVRRDVIHQGRAIPHSNGGAPMKSLARTTIGRRQNSRRRAVRIGVCVLGTASAAMAEFGQREHFAKRSRLGIGLFGGSGHRGAW